MEYPESSRAPSSLKTPTQKGLRLWKYRLSRRLRTLFRLRRLYWLRAELRFAPTEAQRLFGLTVLVGVLCGLAAVAFHLTIGVLEKQLVERAFAAPGTWWIPLIVAVPTVGALLCGVFLHYFVPNARGSGIPQVKAAFVNEDGLVRMRDAIGKFLVGALQIGSGSSLGREGPTVQICAGIASRLGRVFRVSPKSQRRLLPVGVAAGIAAAFNAPIAAVTFTIEEVVGNLDQTVLSGVIVAAALSAVIERSVLGESPVFDVPQSFGLHHASSLLVYAVIGVAAAVVSAIFSRSLLALRPRIRRMTTLPPWAHPAIGGLLTGALAAVAMYFLHTQGVTGGGYATLGRALTSDFTFEVMIALCAMKVVATVMAYASGGAGGIFAPALFIGGMLGGAIGLLDSTALGHLGEPNGAFALVGMGAVFAGIVRAPITSVLIIVEMTDGYSLILPLMIANMTAYVLARRWGGKAIYDALLEQDGIELDVARPPDALEAAPVDSVAVAPTLCYQFTPATRAAEVKRIFEHSAHQRVFPVVDPEQRLLGIVTSEEIRIVAGEPDLLLLTNALDMMRPPVSVQPGDTLRAALDAMVHNGIDEVPVTDAAGHLVGHVDDSAIARAYLKNRQRVSLRGPHGAPMGPSP